MPTLWRCGGGLQPNTSAIITASTMMVSEELSSCCRYLKVNGETAISGQGGGSFIYDEEFADNHVHKLELSQLLSRLRIVA